MKALINVDPQKDFMPTTPENYKNKLGGALAITNGDEVVPVINKLGESGNYDIIIFTMDWHPTKMKAFASQHLGKNPFDQYEVNGKMDTLWPDHCVQNTEGAKFHPDLNLNLPNTYIFKKGEDSEFHPYSGFGGLPDKSSGLLEFLKEKGVTEVHITGLAGDYCCRDTAIDASKHFDTYFIMDAIRFINDDDKPKIINELEKLGVKII